MEEIKIPNRRWADEIEYWVGQQIDAQRLRKNPDSGVPQSAYDDLAELLAGELTKANPGCDFTSVHIKGVPA